MFIKNLKYIITAFTLGLALSAGAVRAIDKYVNLTQPDGSVILVKVVGDEHAHYLISTDGALITEEEGTYYFGKIKENGQIVSTGIMAANPTMRNAQQKAAITLMTPETVEHWNMARHNGPKRVVEQSGMGRFTSNFPRTGDIRGLVVLVSYKDVDFNLDDPQAYFHGLLNSDGFSEYGASGCAAEYFRFNSNGMFRPVFDVIGPVKLPSIRSYYGGNSSQGTDRNPWDMVVHAVKQLDDTVDFSIYDMDGDGCLDNVFIIYAGQGEAQSGLAEAVWPHSSKLENLRKSFYVDGVKVDSYGCTNEWIGDKPDGVGTFIHEFSHVMGLPDLYSTDYSNQATPGPWSVLDYGPYNNDGRTPPNYSSFERLAMGWLDPLLIDGPISVTLGNLADSGDACIIQSPTPTEYYLFENRQQTGWDTYLPNSGMLIWHVDFDQAVFDKNATNNDKSHMHVELKKANNVTEAMDMSQWMGWCWPGTYNKTEFTDQTSPSMKTWAGEALHLPLTNITHSDGLITFDVDGGTPIIAAPQVVELSEYDSDWFEATWSPVDNATDYYLTVLESVVIGEDEIITNDMGTGSSLTLPEGWTASGKLVFTSNGNYGKASPSYKMSTNNSSMTSPKFNREISKISFWHKGMQASGSTLEITGKDAAGNTVAIASIVPEIASARNEIIAEVPAGIYQVEFTYKRNSGSMAIDDIEIVLGGTKTTTLDDYDHISTNGMTTMRVVHPENSAAIYSYFVEATDGVNVSRPSKHIIVPTTGTGIEIASSDAKFGLSGRILFANEEIELFDIPGNLLFRGEGTYSVPQSGVYIIRHNGKAAKLMVK